MNFSLANENVAGKHITMGLVKKGKENVPILYYLPKPTHDTLKPDFPKYLKNTKIFSLNVDITLISANAEFKIWYD